MLLRTSIHGCFSVPICRRKKEEEVAVAMRKLHEKKEENRLTLELKDMIKLNTALLTILNTSKVSHFLCIAMHC